MQTQSRSRERDHPRVPPDVGSFVTRIASDLRSAMIDRHDDGRIIGWGTAARLLMVHSGLMPPQDTSLELARLACLRDLLTAPHTQELEAVA